MRAVIDRPYSSNHGFAKVSFPRRGMSHNRALLLKHRATLVGDKEVVHVVRMLLLLREDPLE